MPISPLPPIPPTPQALLTEEELRIAYLFWQNNKGSGDSRVPAWQLRRDTLAFVQNAYIGVLMAAYAFTSASCILLLAGPIEVHTVINNSTEDGRRLGMDALFVEGGGRILRAAAAGTKADKSIIENTAGYFEKEYIGDEFEYTGLVWFMLGMSNILMLPYVASMLFTPFETLNVFMLSVVRMLKRDLMVFMVLFGLFMMTFYITLYTMYPRAGDVYIPHVMKFNAWYTAIQSLLELAFTGSPANVNLDVDYDDLSYSQTAGLVVFFAIYVFYGVLSVILLINLLIAMLSFTFETVLKDSTLSSRTAFAQCIMRLELIAHSFGMPTAVGDHKGDGVYTYDFRSVDKDEKDGMPAAAICPGNADPFAEKEGGALERLESHILELQRQLTKVDQRMERKFIDHSTQNFSFAGSGLGATPGKMTKGGGKGSPPGKGGAKWKSLVTANSIQRAMSSPPKDGRNLKKTHTVMGVNNAVR